MDTLLHLGVSNALLAGLLALVAALVARFARRPALAHGLWLLVLLKLLTPPLLPVPIPLPSCGTESPVQEPAEPNLLARDLVTSAPLPIAPTGLEPTPAEGALENCVPRTSASGP